MNEIVLILIEYLGEQKKSIEPVAFLSHWSALTDFRAAEEQAMAHLEARAHLCTADEMTSLSAVVDRYQSARKSASKEQPLLAVTRTRGRAGAKAAPLRTEIDRGNAKEFLGAIHDALDERDVTARRAVETFLSHIL